MNPYYSYEGTLGILWGRFGRFAEPKLNRALEMTVESGDAGLQDFVEDLLTVVYAAGQC